MKETEGQDKLHWMAVAFPKAFDLLDDENNWKEPSQYNKRMFISTILKPLLANEIISSELKEVVQEAISVLEESITSEHNTLSIDTPPHLRSSGF